MGNGAIVLLACTVNVDVAAAVGVPLIWPVRGLSNSPEGSDPDVTDHIVASTPSDVRLKLYGSPM